MPLLWLSIAFVAGILVAGWLSLPLFLWSIIACLGLLFAFADRSFLCSKDKWQKIRRVFPFSPGILLVFVALGGMRYLVGISSITDNNLAYYNDRGTYSITARVSAPPDRREDAVYLELSALEIEDPLATDPLLASKAVTGNARARFPAGADWQYGDVLHFTATPATPSDEEHFSYKDYLARKHISTVIYYPRNARLVTDAPGASPRAWPESARQKASQVIFSQYPQPESGLLAGILLGLDQDLPESLTKAYQQTGTAHIIAISGFNMGVLAVVFTWLFSRIVNRYWAAFLSALAIVIYTVFVGGSPAVVRASIMAVTAFGGHLIGRRQSALNALGFTAALMCLVNPFLLWDVSFQLSFAATLGLVLFAEPLQSWADSRLASRLPEEQVAKVSTPLSQYVLFTLAAQLTTLPVIAIHFGRISLSSLLANPLILPVQPPLLIMGGISTVVGAILPGLGRVLSLFVWPLAAYTNWLVERLSRIAIGSVSVNSRSALWIMLFLALFILLFLFRNFFKKLFKDRFYWVIFLLLVGCVSVGSILVHRPDGNLHLNLVNAGDESVIFLRTPQGRTLLLDPGSNVNELSAAVSRTLSPWGYRIDQVWLTDRSAARSLAELDERIPVESVVLPAGVYQAGADARPVEIPPGIAVQKLQPEDIVEYSPGLAIRAVAESYDSAAILVTYDSVKILIPHGVDYALIKESAPDALTRLSVLVLDESDISYIPPRVWQELHPQTILWNSTSLSPVDTWLSAGETNSISLISDGSQVYLDPR